MPGGEPVVGRLPVIAVTGHLGAGKTSVVNHLLRRPGARLGVVVNDFGALDVDSALVVGQVDEAASITGGCLCCLPDAGGLDDALARLAHPRLRLDAILVEASGLADPPSLARLIRFSGVDRVRPGGVVDVVDAPHHFGTVDTGREPPVRYAAAGLVLIGKLDLVPPGDRAGLVARIEQRVHEVNPAAQVVTAPHGRVDPALVYDVASSQDPPDELPLAALVRSTREGGAEHAHAQSVAVPLPGPVAPSALIDLLEDPPAGTYRIKGRVAVRGARGERWYVVHLVGRTVHLARTAARPPAGELVVLGMHLDRPATQARLHALATHPAGRPDAAGLRRLVRYRRLSD